MLKKIITIIFLIITFSGLSNAYEQFDKSPENIYGYKFEANSADKFLKKATYNLQLCEKTRDKELRAKYLQEALRYYFLTTKADKTRIEAYIGLGRVYDLMNLDKYAKTYYSIAYNMDSKNPDLNIKLGDFYNKQKNFGKAKLHYELAYNGGYAANKSLMVKLSQVQAKLGDGSLTPQAYSKAKKAEKFYSPELYKAIKIRLLDEFNLDDPQYYLFIK